MTEGPRGLFRVDPLRRRDTGGIAAPAIASSLVVLGSRQPIDDLDAAALAAGGIEMRRRRGGGGAVLLRPGDCWIELWLPAGGAVPIHDVRATAAVVGSWWREALSSFGVQCDVHAGGVERAREGAVACFAGLGPGELTVGSHKLVGISQFRTKEGALVSCVLPRSAPSGLAPLLSGSASPVPSLAAATSLDAMGIDVASIEIVTAVRRAASASIGQIEAIELTFD